MIKSAIYTTGQKLDSNLIFLGFSDEDCKPSFFDYVFLPYGSTYGSITTFGEATLEYYHPSRQQHALNTLVEDFTAANRIWNRLHTEHDWKSKDYDIFQDFIFCIVQGPSSFISHARDQKLEDCQIISRMNEYWNRNTNDKEKKQTDFSRELREIKLSKFDQTSTLIRNGITKELDSVTGGLLCQGLDDATLRKTFGENAGHIKYLVGRLERHDEIGPRLRLDTEQMYTPR